MMSSGLIQNNATIQVDEERGGGGVRVNSSSATFEMTGGTIATTASVSFGNYALNNHDLNYAGDNIIAENVEQIRI